MALTSTQIGDRLWSIRGQRGRRRRFCINALLNVLEIVHTQHLLPPASADDDAEVADDDEAEPTLEELAEVERLLGEEGDADPADLAHDSEFAKAYTAASRAMDNKLTYETCVLVGEVAVVLYAILTRAPAPTDALTLAIENLEHPEVGDPHLDFDELEDDAPRV